jgi:hypothetical protein
MHSKILRFSGSLELPNHKLGSKEAARHLVVKQMPPIDSRRQIDSGSCNFHFLMPALTLVSLLKKYLWFEIATSRGDIVNRPPAYLLSMI